MVNGTKVPFSAVKAVKAEGNTVKVTMYDTFKAGETYYVDINGSTDLKFTLSGNGAKDVTSIKITTATAEVKDDSSATDVKFILYNADGIDITTTALADANASVNVVAADGTTNAYVSNNTITMYTVGDKATVIATYKFYDPNNNYAETTFSDTKEITAVAPEAYAYSGFVYTIDPVNTRNLKFDESNTKNYVAMGDTADFKAVLKYTKSGNTTKFYVGADNFNGKPIFVKVADEAIATITSAGPNFRIVPNSVGKTNVFVGTTDDDLATGKMTIIAVASIEVKAKRYVASLTVTTNQSTLNPANNNDVITLTALVKDQYGDAIDVNNVSQFDTQQLKQSSDKRPVTLTGWAPTTETGKYECKLGGANGTIGNDTDIDATSGLPKNDTVRNIVFTTKINSNGVLESKANSVTTNFSIKNVAKNPAKDTVEFRSDNASLDTSLTKETNLQKANISLKAFNGGYFTDKIDFSAGYDKITNKQTGATTNIDYYLVKNGETPTAGAVSGSGFALEILKDGARIDQDGVNGTCNNGATDYKDFIKLTAASGEIAVEGMIAKGGIIYKLPAGTYTFRMYVINNGKIAVKTISLSVTDKQVPPAFEQKFQNQKDAVGALVENCFRFTFNGEGGAFPGDDAGVVNSVAAVINSTSGNTNKVFVNGANVTLNITIKQWGNVVYTGTYTIYVPVNKLIDNK